MVDSSASDALEIVSFGPFQLSPSSRFLLESERPIRLGSRAFDLLVALVARAGEVVSRAELLASAWPDTVVSDANLNVQIGALRRTLGDGQAGRRYIVSVTGRGYSFVAPVARSADSRAARHPSGPASHNLPAHLGRLVGRNHIIADLVGRLERRPLVTIVGAGGVGKTAVAVRVAEEAMSAQPDGAWLVDLAPLADAALVPSALARVLSIVVRATDVVAALVEALAERQMLLVFDNCEHVIETVAALAAALLRGARGVRILATSREPLRIKGEQVVQLPPLQAPERGRCLDAAAALSYPAVQLFVERASDASAGFHLADADASRVGEICRRLDGMPLTIELAAARLDVFNVDALAARLEETLRLPGRQRTGLLARHSTIGAALDWSFRLLDGREQTIARRLAVFVGGFTLEAAQAVVPQGQFTVEDIETGLDSLVSKSLVVADAGDRDVRFRFLETTRVYALAMLNEHAEADALGQRHALWLADALAAARSRGESLGQLLERFAPELDNLRAALRWSFGQSGDAALGRRLCDASIRLWFGLSLFSECQAWMRRARDTIPLDEQSTEVAMAIHAAARSAELFTGGATPESCAEWIAHERSERDRQGDLERAFGLIGPWAFNIRLPDYAEARSLAQQHESLAAPWHDDASTATSCWMMALVLHREGQPRAARERLESFLRLDTHDLRRGFIQKIGYDQRSAVRTILGQTLWTLGDTNAALAACDVGVAEARDIGYDLPICEALLWATFTRYLAASPTDVVEAHAREMQERAERHAFNSHSAMGLALRSLCAGRRGDIDAAIEGLRRALGLLEQAHYGPFDPLLVAELANLLALRGEADAGLDEIRRLEQRHRNTVGWCMPEMRRQEGVLLAMQSDPGDRDRGRRLIETTRDEATARGEVCWATRCATSLASLVSAG
jgi:predicted ATPase/DNA-binding winged helix-turn-helix (wHTH) protein